MGLLIFTVLCLVFFFSSRRRHTRCALVTGVQTCALPICWHWIFLINAPVGLLLISLAGALLHDSPAQLAAQQQRKARGLRVDYIGFALIALSMGDRKSVV